MIGPHRQHAGHHPDRTCSNSEKTCSTLAQPQIKVKDTLDSLEILVVAIKVDHRHY